MKQAEMFTEAETDRRPICQYATCANRVLQTPPCPRGYCDHHCQFVRCIAGHAAAELKPKTRVAWSVGDWFVGAGGAEAHRVHSLGAEPWTGALRLRFHCLSMVSLNGEHVALAAADCVKATNEPRCKECE